MVAQQRQAMFNLAITLGVVALFLALIPVLGAARAQGAFGFLALLGIGPLFYRKTDGQSVCDERDQLIRVRAMQITMATLFCAMVSLPWAVYLAHHGTGSIPVSVLPSIAWFGWLWFEACQSASKLALYRWM